MVAMTVGVLVLTAITSSVLTSLVNSRVSNESNEAAQIAQEGIEIARSSRTAAAGTYCLDQGVSRLSGIPQGTCTAANVSGKYIRSVDVVPGTASDCGIDVNKTVVTVKWTDSKCADGSYCHKSVLSSCMNVIALAGTVTPTPPAPGTPTVNVTATLTTMTVGNSTTLSWTSTDAVTCTASGGTGFTGAKSASGSLVVSPTTTTTYSMYCTSGTGVNSTTFNRLITVNPLPTATIDSSPNPIILGGAGSTLTWSSTNATGCTASGGWSGAKAASGSVAVNPATNTTYTIVCTSADGYVSSPVSEVLTVNLFAQLLLNSGFESGAGQTNWIIQQTDATAPDGPICQESTTYCTNTTPDGAWYLKLGGLMGNGTQYDDQVYQSVTLPATTVDVTVSFKYRIISDETTTTLENDNFYPTVKDSTGTNITNGTIAHFTNLNETSGTTWVQSPTYNITSILTNYFGQTIRLRFVSNNNTTLKTNMLIDQVQFNVTYGQ
ncbi:MAG: hypothetical protein RLZZ455_375 [Candidatus Parcubacteria bacterium]